MSALPDVTIPAKNRLPIDQMEMGLDLLRTVHAGLQDHTFIDRDVLLAFSGTMFVALDVLEPVRDVLNKAHRETQNQTGESRLVKTINEFRAGSAAFSGWESRGYANEEEAVKCTYGPSVYALENWTDPLETLEDVREAVRMAFTEDAILADIVKEPLRAALIYLEKITGWKEPIGGAA